MKINERTKIDIERENSKILREIGLKSPPIRVENVIEHLKTGQRFLS
jgi:hypothetical protein